MKSSTPYIILVIIIAASLNSCQKFLDEKPESSLARVDVFKDLAGAEAAMAGSYEAMISLDYFGQNIHALNAFSAKELINRGGNPGFAQFNNHNIAPSNGSLYSLWSTIYRTIGRTNNVIGFTPAINGDEAVKNRILAEAYALRAYNYFQLVRTFGNVPLYIQPITDANDESQVYLANATVEQVYNQILSDLKEAEGRMPEDFDAAGRINLATIQALLAKVSLYTGDYPTAAQYAQTVLNTTDRMLIDDYGSIFTTTGDDESLWEIVFTPSSGHNGLNPTLLPQVAPFDGQATNVVYFEGSGASRVWPLIDFYPSGDLRKNALFYTDSTYYYIVKYPTNPDYDWMSAMRLAEVYLIYAEAEARNSNAVTLPAFEAYNAVRIRAGVPDTITNYPSVDVFIDQVVEEKRRELLMENESWYDYVRAGKADEFGVTDPNMYLYPIPQQERDQNPKLNQNDGYF